MISQLFAWKYGNLNKFCKFQLLEGVDAVLKKVGLYIQIDWYLISNSLYTINLASKLKRKYSNFIWFDSLICRFII